MRADSPYQLTLNGGERWASPLGDMIGRALAEDLSSRLPGSSVFTSSGAISADPNATVEVDIQRFDAASTGPVTLLGAGRRHPRPHARRVTDADDPADA